VEKTRYLIEYDVGIEDKLKEIPKTMRLRIKKAIEERLTLAPSEYGKPLINEWKDHRRIRVGDYRVIYRVFEDRVIVFIVEIDHRKDVYK
jgi:mRNA interferase RelE/StbE